MSNAAILNVVAWTVAAVTLQPGLAVLALLLTFATIGAEWCKESPREVESREVASRGETP